MPKDTEKKERIKAKIVEMVTHAEKQFSLGVGFRILSQKLLKSVRHAGYDLDEILRELDGEGRVFLYTDENYSRLVMVPEMREYYILGVIGEETEATRNFISGKWGRRGRASGAKSKTEQR